MVEMKLKHFKIIYNNSKSESNSLQGGYDGCGYEDAPVCQDGSKDVECGGERYRGCYPGEYDCADSLRNLDHKCCWGHGPGSGDNIDHAQCNHDDAGWGHICKWGIDIPLMI